VMRGITMDGRLSTLVREAVRDSRDSVLCLTPLLPHVSEHLLVSWDGSPIPRGTCARLWPKVGQGRFI
jgi:hypothetical protein